jgi:hypothetical protein
MLCEQNFGLICDCCQNAGMTLDLRSEAFITTPCSPLVEMNMCTDLSTVLREKSLCQAVQTICVGAVMLKTLPRG